MDGAGPEILAAYKAMSGNIDTRIDRRHHEATVGAQTAFFENVKATTTVMQDMGNPFQDESSELLSLDTKNIADPSLAQLKREDCSSPRCSSVVFTMKNARSIIQSKRTRLLSLSKSSALVVSRKRH